MDYTSLKDEALNILLAHHNKLKWNPKRTEDQVREVLMFLKTFDITSGEAAIPADLIYYKYYRSKSKNHMGRLRFTRIIRLLMPHTRVNSRYIFKLDPVKLDLDPSYSYYKDPRFYKRIARKTKYKGVKPAPFNEWIAEIEIEGKLELIGFFSTSVEAAKAYNEAAKYYFGKKAKLNVIRERKEKKKG